MAVRALKRDPRLIGKYEVLGRLAATEMGTVFKGRDPTTGCFVAIKLAGPALTTNPVGLRRFEQEFKVTRALDHPHIVRALQFGQESGVPYMVLEFVDGQSLGDRIEHEGKLPEVEAVRIAARVGEALHHAHCHQVVHRDVKPDNILLTAERLVKLADLGLAKDYDSDAGLTRASMGLGTPNFMAPEQFSDAKNADRRCDVYSLGATLYMALTGELPFPGRGALTVLKKKLANDLVPPRQLVPTLSPWVESAIVRAVDANPRARQGSCLEFVKEICGEAEGAQNRPATQAPSARADRRATLRFPASRGTSCQPLRGDKGHVWRATIRDISADGVGLVVARRFEPRTVLALEMPATEQEAARRLLVRVVRVSALSQRRWFLGCIFATRLADEEVQDLR
jgi:serine/threonine protein kinase